jgi:hypothetical protein
MKVSRRDAIRAGLAGGALAAVSGCSRALQLVARDRPSEPLRFPKAQANRHVRILNRAGFGPRPGDVASLQAQGIAEYVEQQLRADAPEGAYLTLMLHRLDALRIEGGELRELPHDRVVEQLQQAAFLRAVYSPNQLRERLADFWTNHFNVYARKEQGGYRKPADDAEVIRAHALGKFPEMLKASASSPSMLAYLDNTQNRVGVANENYARELMELHTLGVDGGYTQHDVAEVARCFTGWTVETRFLRPKDRFRFDMDLHDNGEKSVLGRRIPAGGGAKDAEIVLAILAEHPSTARFIASKLCRYFLGEAGAAWVQRTADTYLKTGGDIREMVRPLLLSDELAAGPPLLKRPFDYAVSALRAFDADTDGGRAIQRQLADMGQPLFEWPMPDGYPDKTAAWTGSLLARWNFALALARGGIAGTSIDLARLFERAGGASAEALSWLTLGEVPSPDLAEILNSAKTSERNAGQAWAEPAALCLCSPAFQWR